MKYNLDDLISKSFEEKEKVSPEFMQSVIKEMQGGFGGTRRKNARIIAAACAGVVMVAGITALIWKDDTSVQQDTKWKTALQTEKPSLPDARNRESAGVSDGISANTEEKSETMGNLSENSSAASHQKAESTNSVKETAAVSDRQDRKSASDKNSEKKDKLETDKNSEKKDKTDNLKNSEKTSDNTEKEDKNASDSQNPDVVSDGEEKPTVTAKPAEPTAKPSEPGIIQVLGNYVQLCSMRQLSDSSLDLEMQHVSTWNSLVEEALDNTAIYTYEQLLEYQAKTRERFLEFQFTEYITGEKFLPALEQYFKGLQQYDKAYFQNNVLYIHHTYETCGYDFRLHAVNLVEKEDGKLALNVEIEKFWPVPDDVCMPSVMESHMCLVQIPRNVTGAYDTIEGQIVRLEL